MKSHPQVKASQVKSHPHVKAAQTESNNEVRRLMEQSFFAQHTHRYIFFSSPITRAAHVPEVAQDIHHGLDAVFSPEHGMKLGKQWLWPKTGWSEINT